MMMVVTDKTTPADPIPLKDTQEFGASFNAGTVLNETYELRDVLGSGGMGQVWDAFDRKLGRPVAIKISWPHAPPGLLRAAPWPNCDTPACPPFTPWVPTTASTIS